MSDFSIDFERGQGLLPAIVQDWKTGEVLMVAYMNAASWAKTQETGKACFWSRSRQKLWLKGETSGHVQIIKEVYLDCDNDALECHFDENRRYEDEQSADYGRQTNGRIP